MTNNTKTPAVQKCNIFNWKQILIYRKNRKLLLHEFYELNRIQGFFFKNMFIWNDKSLTSYLCASSWSFSMLCRTSSKRGSTLLGSPMWGFLMYTSFILFSASLRSVRRETLCGIGAETTSFYSHSWKNIGLSLMVPNTFWVWQEPWSWNKIRILESVWEFVCVCLCIDIPLIHLFLDVFADVIKLGLQFLSPLLWG